MTRPFTSIESRFWPKVKKGDPEECWEWTASKNDGGYGIIGLGTRQQGTERAHRVSWELHFGRKDVL